MPHPSPEGFPCLCVSYMASHLKVFTFFKSHFMIYNEPLFSFPMKYSVKGGVLLRHWRAEFMKHVLPRLERPHRPEGEREGERERERERERESESERERERGRGRERERVRERVCVCVL